ncbi:MAG TPA: HupE/UreJ family protein [Kofleriaceae bacterium]|nr:HupE/UreJ family protein [Kofleriaceae bacterium]
MRIGVLVLALVAFAPRAFAHQTSVKYIDLAIHDTTVSVELRCAATDVTEPMGLPADAKPTVEEALAVAGVVPYVQHWLVLTGCTASAPRANRVDDKFIAVTWTATCPRVDAVEVDLGALFALDRRQEAIIQLAKPGSETIQTIVRAEQGKVTLRAGQSPSLLAWIRTGMDHIYDGVDHICFVLALLLVVMLTRSDGREWRIRPFITTLRSTAVVITAFTIAHSISLIAAALGYVELPSRFVESMIALSIAYTAAEDIVRPDVRWRYGLTFGFGLIHGLGFAATLAELLPPRDVVVPLLCFNVGVEIGQLSIVLVALPVFYGVARVAGGERYRHTWLPLLAGIIFLLGLTMLVERILSVKILPM